MKEWGCLVKSTKFGDDKDRVIIREDGRGTYLSVGLSQKWGVEVLIPLSMFGAQIIMDTLKNRSNH